MTEGRFDEQRLARHGSAYMAGRVAQVLSYVLVMPFVTRELTAAAYGEVAVALVVFQVLAAVAPMGLTAVMAWSIYERQPDAEERAQRLLVSTTALTAAVVLAAQVTGTWWSGGLFSGMSFDGPLRLTVWMVLPFTVQAGALAMFQARARPGAFVASALVSTVGGQLAGVALLRVDASPASYLAGVLAGAVAGAVLGLALLPLRTARPASAATVMASIRHGGPAVPHLLGFLVLALGDRVLVERLLGLDEAARYQIAYVVGSLGSVVLYGLNNAWGPMVYGAPPSERWATLVRTVRPLAWLMASITAVVALTAPVGIRLLAPPEYQLGGLADVATVVAGVGLLDLTYLACVHVLFARKRTGSLLFVMPMAALLNVVANLVFLERFGLPAAAWATGASYLLMAALALRASQRVATVPWELRPLWGAVFLAVSSVGACLALPDDGPVVVARAAVGVAIGVVMLAGARRMVTGSMVSAG